MKKTIGLLVGIVLMASPAGGQQCFFFQSGTGNFDTIVITNVTINNQPLELGTEIGVFDDELCVGAITTADTLTAPYVLTAWEMSEFPQMPGYLSGNPMTFKLCHPPTDLLTVVDANYLLGDGTFGFFPYTVINLTILNQPILDGDVDGSGSVDENDIWLISEVLLKRYYLTSTQFPHADRDNDGAITFFDLIALIEMLVN